MKIHSIFPILALLVLPLFISCPAKTPVPDIQEQVQVYNIEDLPLSENVVKHINSGKENKYVVYTFYTVLDKKKIHKQYWEGLLVFDDIPYAEQPIIRPDNNGKVVKWRENPLRKSYIRDVYNVNGVLFRRTTINPDGSAIDSVDINGDGTADYTVASLANGDELVIASDPLGMEFLNELLEDRLAYCNNAETIGVPRDEIPGCRGSSSPDGTGLTPGVGPADAGNPYDSFMENMCAGYGSRDDRFSGATRARNLIGVERRNTWWGLPDRTSVTETIVETFDDGSTITYENSVVTENNGTVTFLSSKREDNIDGSSVTNGSGVTNRPDGSTETSNYTTRGNPDGSSTERGTTVIRRSDGSTTTQHWRTTTRSDGSSTERRWERTDRADGTSSATPVTETECSSDGSCSEPVPAPDSSTENPGPEPDHDAAMGEICDAWRQSKESRANDIDELNRSANEERCSIEPDESAESDGSSLTENCYFDIQGRDEIAEMIAGGTCVTATGGAHFDYDSEGSRTCRTNRFFILENTLLSNGPAGLNAIEVCPPDDLTCRPEGS